tara:strand:+ start:53 stop:454 length:402 start_codon:yes stop_codon:yes gene_type:complete
MARKSRREHLTPELTPLIDVVFLLLIFFMVSSVFKKEELALLLSLPKTETGQSDVSSQQKFITIELSKTELALDGKIIEFEDFIERLPSINKSSLINLRVEGNVEYDRLVKVLDLLQKNKLENLSLITVKKKK